jgi:hemoglobin-like flavoprotein
MPAGGNGMTPSEGSASMALNVAVLEESFAAISPRGAKFVASFYQRLLSEHPQARPLFANVDMAGQQRKLLAALALVVENLRRPEILGPALRELGKRHAGYGVTADHYPLVGATLLATFAEFLDGAFTPEVRQAWADAYGAITSVMLEGAGGSAS